MSPLRLWIKSANFAIEGVLHAAATQRHVRYHFYAASLVLTLSYIVGVSRGEFLLIALAVMAVLMAEMMNTAVERIVDIVSPGHCEAARSAKDIAAGAVLITAFGAAVIGYVILYPYMERALVGGLSVAQHPTEENALISLILVVIAVILIKAYTGKGHPLSGGMPSGHAAIAFSVWMSATFASRSLLVSGVCLALASLLAKSRVNAGVHKTTEVMAGAALGSIITLVLFWVFG